MKKSRLTERRKAIIDSTKEQEMITQTFYAKELQFFAARTPANFTERCIQAAKDFIIVKETIVNSKDWKTRCNLTISRKLESRYKVFQFGNRVPLYYQTNTMLMIHD